MVYYFGKGVLHSSIVYEASAKRNWVGTMIAGIKRHMRTRLYGGDVTVCRYTHMSLFLFKENDYGHIGEVNSPEGFMESLQLRLKLWLVPNLSIHQALRNLPTDNL